MNTWKTWAMVIAALLIGAAIGIGAGYLLWGRSQGQPLPPPPPGAGDAQAIPGPSIVHGDPVLPQPDEHISGVLRIVVHPDSGTQVDQSKPREIFVYIDEDPGTPPRVRSGWPVQTSYSPVIDPWLTVRPRLMVGASGSFDGYVSPWAGVSLVQLFQKVNIGAGADRSAIGLFVGYEWFREFNVGPTWSVLRWRDGASIVGVSISYRF